MFRLGPFLLFVVKQPRAARKALHNKKLILLYIHIFIILESRHKVVLGVFLSLFVCCSFVPHFLSILASYVGY